GMDAAVPVSRAPRVTRRAKMMRSACAARAALRRTLRAFGPILPGSLNGVSPDRLHGARTILCDFALSLQGHPCGPQRDDDKEGAHHWVVHDRRSIDDHTADR